MKGSRQQGRPLVPAAFPMLLPLLKLYATVESSCKLLPGYLSTNDYKETSGFGETVYYQPLRTAHWNRRATTVPKTYLSHSHLTLGSHTLDCDKQYGGPVG